MKKGLKLWIHENKIMYSFLLGFRWTQYKILYLINEIVSVIRLIGVGNRRYSSMRYYKGKHTGERCFIVATGPSLTFEDLEKLKDEKTFGVNSICLAYEKTKFRPTYFGVMDYDVYQKIKDSTDEIRKENVFVSKKIDKYENREKKWNVIPVDKYYHWYDTVYKKEYNAKFSNNAMRLLYDSNTVTYIMIQLAVYMGFKEIYLVGVDCNYKQEKKRFMDHGHLTEIPGELELRMTAGYREAKKYSLSHDVDIYNCTRGGMLEVFERRDLDMVLKKG